MRFSAYDLAPHVSKFCLKEWQDIWDACQGNKLYAIYPNVGDYQYKSSLWRRDRLINTLRIGNTRLTHSGDDQPVCSACQSPLTVKHFLIYTELLTFFRNSRWRPPPSWIFRLCEFDHFGVLILCYLSTVPNVFQISVVTEIDALMLQTFIWWHHAN